MTEAATLRCPACGASVAPRAESCPYCSAALHPIRCPWCFGWTFSEARDCGRCGSTAEPAEGPPPSCPTCRAALSGRRLGGARLAGCDRCGGVWTDAASFKALCSDRGAQAAYLGDGSVLPAPKPSDPSTSPVVYRPCARCGELMNRFNFADCSGVILDACKPHGVWFDADELRRIVEFIRGGGLDVARAKERTKLELERRRLEQAAADPSRGASGFVPPLPASVASARGLLRLLFGDPG